jgi:hypothetical protein
MRWAVSPRGAGQPVGFRGIRDDSELQPGEFASSTDPAGLVLAADAASLRTPTSAELLVPLKRARQNYINDRREIAIASGAEFNGWTFDTDERSVANLTAAVAFIQAAPDYGFPVPPAISWRDATNFDRALTPAQLVGLGAVIFTRVQTAHGIARALKDAIEAATTEAAIRAIDWPA